MLVYWCLIEGCILPLPRPRTTVLGVSVLDDEGVIRAWEVMQAQVGSGLVPSEGARGGSRDCRSRASSCTPRPCDRPEAAALAVSHPSRSPWSSSSRALQSEQKLR